MKLEMDNNTTLTIWFVAGCITVVLGMASCVGCIRAINQKPAAIVEPAND